MTSKSSGRVRTCCRVMSAIASKQVTYDFARLMEGATELKTSEFGDNIIEHM